MAQSTQQPWERLTETTWGAFIETIWDFISGNSDITHVTCGMVILSSMLDTLGIADSKISAETIEKVQIFLRDTTNIQNLRDAHVASGYESPETGAPVLFETAYSQVAFFLRSNMGIEVALPTNS